MPAAPRIISLNVGSQTMGLAEFRTQAHGGLALQRCGLRELVVDPADEGMRRSWGPALHRVQLKTASDVAAGRWMFAIA